MRIIKIRSKITMVILAMSFFLLPSNRVYGVENTIDIPLTVIQEFDISSKDINTVDTKGVYELTALDNNFPMPDGSKDNRFIFSMDEKNDEFTIPLMYKHSGVYRYNIQQKTQHKENYIYDENIYDLTVYVKRGENGKLTSQVIVRNKQGEKCGDIRFVNECHIKNKTYDNSNEIDNSSKIGTLPKTGDNTKFWLYIFMFMTSLGLLIFLKWNEYKKRE